MIKKNIAIITARGGSKRIPKKNIKDFCGQPIIAYSIKAALESNIFDDVMVSTDDAAIADIAKNFGATIPFLRSADTSNDYATTSDVVLETLLKYQSQDINFEYLCCIYPTAPFISSDKLREGYEKFIQSSADSAMTVVKYSFPPQRGYFLENGLLKMSFPEYKNIRSQDIDSMYHDAGQFYFSKVSAFMQEKSIITRRCIPIILPESEVQDIDNFDDWKTAELKYEILRNKDEAF